MDLCFNQRMRFKCIIGWQFGLSLVRLSEWSKGIKIIDFSEVPSDVLPVVTGTLARLLYDIQFWMNEQKRTPFTLVCDEAHLYLPIKEDADAVQKQALYNFERIAKEGRSMGYRFWQLANDQQMLVKLY